MKRFTLIDGLRGIAALMVVIGHLYLTVEESFTQYLPAAVNNLFKQGHWGIEIFFVISGFVIAYSVRNGTWSFSYLARFGLRRSIRLDPPYWLIIVLEIILIYLSLHFFPELKTRPPSFEQVAAHLVYLQELLGLGHLLPIFWTLCYEVQFYLVLVSSLVLYSSLSQRTGNNSKITFTVFAAIGLAAYLFSLGTFLHLLPASIPGLFIDRWYQFCLGALAWWCVSNPRLRWLFFVTWFATLAILPFIPAPDHYRIESTLIILAVSMLVYLAAITDKLSDWLNSPTILFLGTISYSLYLIHLPVGWRLIALEKKLFGDDMSLLGASLALISGILISILAAWLLHIAVEKPSLNFAHRIRLPKTTSKARPLINDDGLETVRAADK